MKKILISFDTTGSMSPAIAEVRRRVEDTVNKLFEAYGNDLQMCLLAHGDYLDARRGKYDVTHTGFMTNKAELINFVRTVQNTNGYSSKECYELVLKVAADMDWTADSKALVMIGDAEPHIHGRVTDDGIVCKLDWRNELSRIANMGVSVYSVQCLGRYGDFWRTLGTVNQGAYVTLNQFSHINELLLAIGHKESGTLDDYVIHLKDTGLLLNRGVAEFINQLQGKGATDWSLVKTKEGLVPVEPGRFQVLHIDTTIAIKEFVESTGAKFRTGRGFYELTKSETVQESKEVVLVDKSTGDMLTGKEARNIIGIPFGTRGRTRPNNRLGYDVFIQSTSYNRKLMPNTKFLYETEK